MAGCPSGQWELTVNQSRKLRRFEPCTCHVKIPPCIVCGNEVKNVGGLPKGVDINQPHGATTFETATTGFITHGHYGSTVFDPMNPSVWLEINVCDDCLTERQDRVLHATKAPKGFAKPVIYEKWNRFKHG